MQRAFNFKAHDLIKFKVGSSDFIHEYVVGLVSPGQAYDSITVPGFDFVKVYADKLKCYGTGELIELVEVYRFYDEVYKRIYKKD